MSALDDAVEVAVTIKLAEEICELKDHLAKSIQRTRDEMAEIDRLRDALKYIATYKTLGGSLGRLGLFAAEALTFGSEQATEGVSTDAAMDGPGHSSQGANNSTPTPLSAVAPGSQKETPESEDKDG